MLSVALAGFNLNSSYTGLLSDKGYRPVPRGPSFFSVCINSSKVCMTEEDKTKPFISFFCLSIVQNCLYSSQTIQSGSDLPGFTLKATKSLTLKREQSCTYLVCPKKHA